MVFQIFKDYVEVGPVVPSFHFPPPFYLHRDCFHTRKSRPFKEADFPKLLNCLLQGKSQLDCKNCIACLSYT